MATPDTKYYLYRHIRPDTGEVFYVGLGKQDSKRYLDNSGRNRHWKNVFNMNNGCIEREVMLEDMEPVEAVIKEKEFVALYGRVCKGTGTLVNVLDGGQYQDIGFNSGKEWSEETRRKLSESHKGNQATKGRISITNGTINRIITPDTEIPFGWYRGSTRARLTQETRNNMSLASKGKSKNLTPEQLQKKSQAMLGNSGASGKFWIHNGTNSRYLTIGSSIPEGWVKGKLYRNRI